jgi:hypothetical protein
MHAIDGCDSQKRDKTAGTCEERTFSSDLFLSRDFVNSFKDDVKLHRAAERAQKATSMAAVLEDGSTVPKDENDDRCGRDWKAAMARELPPVSKEAFEQTGVFACVCWHGIVEFLIEFVQSAEMLVFMYSHFTR